MGGPTRAKSVKNLSLDASLLSADARIIDRSKGFPLMAKIYPWAQWDWGPVAGKKYW